MGFKEVPALNKRKLKSKMKTESNLRKKNYGTDLLLVR